MDRFAGGHAIGVGIVRGELVAEERKSGRLESTVFGD